MRRLAGAIGVAVWIGAASSVAGAQQATAQSLVAEGASMQQVAGDLAFGEGPAWDGHGNLYFSDIPRNRIMKVDSTGKVSIFTDESGGANGLYFDKAGNLYACETVSRRVTKRAPDGTMTVLADRCEGKRLNQPNDLWVDPKGGVYFTDPVYSPVKGREIDTTDVYYIRPGGETIRVASGMHNPNGIIGTADGKKLYVAALGDKQTFVFDIAEDGTLTNKTLFASRGSDGMTLDVRGNVYMTTGKRVQVFSPGGQAIETIDVPEGTTNCTFGGPDNHTLYISCPKGIYAIRMRVSGQ